jgi:Carboxypeptidase regulatory-like domain
MRLSPFYTLSLFLYLFALVAPVSAQTSTGMIRGTVYDSSKAVIAGVKVTIRNEGTGVERTTTSNSTGEYLFTAVLPGDYELKVEAQGFKKQLTSIKVQVGENITTDFDMEVGQTAETVVVTSEAPAINTTDFKVDGVVGRAQIENLPLNGRNFLQLAMLEPGVTVESVANPGTSPNNFFRVSIAGAHNALTRISVDGATVNDRITGGTSQNFSQETVQEFQISTFNFDMASSVTSVGSVNIVSRTGKNQLNGSAFIYYRDHNIAAFPGLTRDPRRFENESFNDPFFARRQMGGSLGGPIKKDRFFWFYNVENNNQDGVFAVNNNHPIFSQYDHIAPNPLNAIQHNLRLDGKLSEKHSAFLRVSSDNNDNFNPNGGVRMPSNWIATENVSMQGLLGVTSVFTPRVVNDVRFSYGYYSGNLRNPTENDCTDPVFCIGLGGFLLQTNSGDFRIGNNEQTPQNRVERTFQLTDTLSWQSGSHRFRFGGEWEHAYLIGSWARFEPARIEVWDPVRLLPLFVADPNRYGPLYNSLPDSLKLNFTVSPAGAVTILGPLRPGLLPTPADLRKLPLSEFTTGIGDAGQPQPFNRDRASHNDRLRFFFQDAWRIKNNFTFNFGLAYVYENRLLNHDLDRPQLLGPLFGGDLSAPKRDKNNFDPAVGFAWDVGKNGKTVIRGGSGIYHDSNLFWVRLQERFFTGPSGNGRAPLDGTLVPFAASPTGVLDFSSNPCLNPQPGIPATICVPLSVENFLPNLPTIRGQLASRLGDGTDLGVRGIQLFKTGSQLYDPNTVVPYALNATLGVQRELARNLYIQADFVLRRSVHFGGLHDVGEYDRNLFNRPRVTSVNPDTGEVRFVRNPVLPQCSGAQAFNPTAICSNGEIGVYESSFNFTYTGLHVKVDKRYANRYFFTASYALSKFTGFNDDIINAFNLHESQGYQPADRRHKFTLSGAYEIPAYGGGSRFLRGLLNTWQVSLISQIQSRPPLNLDVGGFDVDGDGISRFILPGARVNSFGRQVSKEELTQLVDSYNADIAARTRTAPDGRQIFPRTPQNQILLPIALPANFDNGDNFFSQDLRLTRLIRFREKATLSLIAEGFNIFNISNLDNYEDTLTNANFGKPSRRVGQVFGTGGPRAFQFAARLTF